LCDCGKVGPGTAGRFARGIERELIGLPALTSGAYFAEPRQPNDICGQCVTGHDADHIAPFSIGFNGLKSRRR
jgi:hypothetical protein